MTDATVTDPPTNEDLLRDHISATYRWLRITLAGVGIALPVLLAVLGWIYGLDLQGSMSAYYHASLYSQNAGDFIHPGEGSLRDVFVGSLFALGAILFVYRGYSVYEDRALNLAGLSALGVAVFPMSWIPKAGGGFPGLTINFLGIKFSAHGACAITLFACIGYVAIFRSADTLGLITNRERRQSYESLYRWLGAAMWAFPVAVFLATAVFRKNASWVFWLEAAGIVAFAAYWWQKSQEIQETEADQRAVSRSLKVTVLPNVLSRPQFAEAVADGLGDEIQTGKLPG